MAMGVLMYYNTDCYQLGVCYSKSLPSVDNFVGREEDIRNITGYLDFTTSDVQVVHIVGPPGFGKSTLAKKVGEILVRRRRIKVFYVDLGLGMVKDINALSEHVMMSIVDDMIYGVSLNRVVKWVRDQYSNTLIILDNCDKLFEYSKEDFLQAIKKRGFFKEKCAVYINQSEVGSRYRKLSTSCYLQSLVSSSY